MIEKKQLRATKLMLVGRIGLSPNMGVAQIRNLARTIIWAQNYENRLKHILTSL